MTPSQFPTFLVSSSNEEICPNGFHFDFPMCKADDVCPHGCRGNPSTGCFNLNGGACVRSPIVCSWTEPHDGVENEFLCNDGYTCNGEDLG